MRAGVQVSSDPPLYEFGEPTDWVLADRIVDIIPSPPRKQMHSVLIYIIIVILSHFFVRVYDASSILQLLCQ